VTLPYVALALSELVDIDWVSSFVPVLAPETVILPRMEALYELEVTPRLPKVIDTATFEGIAPYTPFSESI
jgi:hypothetical protein